MVFLDFWLAGVMQPGKIASMSLRSKIVSGYAWVFSGFVAKAVAYFVALVLLSRVLSKAEFGEISLIFAIYNLLWTSFEVAIGYTVVRLPTARKPYLHGLYTASLLSGVVVCLALIGSAQYMSHVYQTSTLFWPSVLLAVGVMMRAASVMSENLLYKDMHFKLLSRIEIAGYVAFIAALVGCLYAGYAFWAMPAGQFAYMALKSILCLYFRPHSRTLALPLRIARQIAHFLGGYVVTSFLSSGAGEADKFVVGRLLGLAALGIYGRAVQLFMLPASVLGQALDNVLTSALAAHRRDHALCARAVYSATSAVAAALLPLGVMFYFLAPEIVAIVLGQGWEEVVVPLQILSFSMYFRTAMKTAEAVLRAQGMVYQRMYAYIVFDLCFIAVLFIGARHFGMEGAAIAVAIANLLFYFILMFPVMRFLNLSYARLALLHVRGLVLSALLWGFSAWWVPVIREFTHIHILVVLGYGAGVLIVLAAMMAAAGPRRVLGPEGDMIFKQVIGWIRPGKTAAAE
jgi:PST family polysaccharide transporter